MKFVTYIGDAGNQRLGVWTSDDEIIVDLASAHQRLYNKDQPAFAGMQDLIEAGQAGLDLAHEVLSKAGEEDRISTSSVELLAPLPRPIQMRDCLCFEQHIVGISEAIQAMTGQPPAQRHHDMVETMKHRPIYYKCNRFATVGPGVTVHWPSYSHVMDYELEMAMVIGQTGRNIAREDAADHIFGYSIFNDLSARDTQALDMPGALGPGKSKDFDGANILGPCIVTADEFDPYSAGMNVRINGELQSSNTAELMNPRFEDLIAFISESETLHAGEILCSGTVGGGSGTEAGRLLAHEDEIELEIVGIGRLRNRIVRDDI